MKRYTLRHGFNEMDFDKITSMLAKVWWSPGIAKNEVVRGANNSALVVGAFDENREQIGFARVISDKTRFAYIMDVVVDERLRKRGIGRAMINYILKHQDLTDVYQWCLLTKDAHGVYAKLGFKPLATPENWMEIRKERPRR
ncbi:MAG TPA: GNAT family N-acetyltransferase [Bacteroidales bacterium]|nr:GNAT family N-acetyltransferase [Bacteroidales bacterium]